MPTSVVATNSYTLAHFLDAPNYAHRIMVKKGKLLVAFDAYKGLDYRSEEQVKQQKQAAKTKRTRAQRPNSEKENVEAEPNGMTSMPQIESDGWESDESEVAQNTTVCSATTILTIHLTLIGP